MKKVLRIVSMMAVVALFLTAILPAGADTTKTTLFYNGEIVNAVVTPGELPNGGNDPLFVVVNGQRGQLNIAGVAPGDPGYNGGAWAVHEVQFTGARRPLLTSKADVKRAVETGIARIRRNPCLDFRCPINPGKPVNNGNNGNNTNG